ncbi:MAG: RNase adapter RapZ [Pseudomonadota bacterium]
MKYRDTFPKYLERPNFIFDCRGITNPGRIDKLKPLNGKDAAVIAFLEKEPDARAFFNGVQRTALDTIPAFAAKQYSDELAIGFGCTGGQHRSVYFAEQAAALLTGAQDDPPTLRVRLEHLDIDAHYTLGENSK